MVRRTTVNRASVAGQEPAEQVTVPVYTTAGPAQPKTALAPETQPDVTDFKSDLQKKFHRLRDLAVELKENKDLYKEREELIDQLLPLFVNVTPTDIIIHREITVAGERHTLTPLFIDAETGMVRVKVFKATMMETFSIS